MKIWGWPGDLDGCRYYRVKVPLDALATRGHEVGYGVYMPPYWREQAEIVVAQRVYLPEPSTLFRHLIDKGIKVVYEIDDDLFSMEQRGNSHAEYFAQSHVKRAIKDNMAAAAMVTVTTDALAEIAAKHNPNVVILPNYLPESILELAAAARYDAPDRGFIIGWGGSSTHKYDWFQEACRPVMHTLNAHPHVRMRFLGNEYPTGLPRDRVEFLPWTKDMNVHYGRVANFDIGLAPLVRNKFNKSKSWLKMAEHMMCGVPAICSPLPDYVKLVDHGRTGFVAKSEKEWRDTLHELVTDNELRMLVGQQARKFAAENLTIEGNAHKWEDAYRSLL